jgi:hypothetical protein
MATVDGFKFDLGVPFEVVQTLKVTVKVLIASIILQQNKYPHLLYQSPDTN